MDDPGTVQRRYEGAARSAVPWSQILEIFDAIFGADVRDLRRWPETFHNVYARWEDAGGALHEAPTLEDVEKAYSAEKTARVNFSGWRAGGKPSSFDYWPAEPVHARVVVQGEPSEVESMISTARRIFPLRYAPESQDDVGATAGAPKGGFLAHPYWLGIGALAAVASVVIALVAIYLSRDSKQTSPAARTDSTLTTRTTTNQVTVTTGGTSGERDPKVGTVFINNEASREFFGGLLVAGLSEVNYNGGGLAVTRLVIRANPIAPCVFRLVRTGDARGAATKRWLYWIEIRGLSVDGADLVAHRKRVKEAGNLGCRLVARQP